jgi:hypothetical protein
MFLNQTGIFNANLINTIPNSVYNQLLYVPVRAGKTTFSKEKNGPGHFIKAVVTRYRSGTEHATGHTRERWAQIKKAAGPIKIKYL